MLSALLCAVVLSAAPEAVEIEGLGREGTLPDARPALMRLPRVRAGASGLGVIAAQPNFDVAGGAGLALELGVVIGDRVSLFWHGEIATTLFNLYGSNGVHADVALGDHFALGLGVSFTLWSQFAYLEPSLNYSYFAGFTFPVRAHFTLPERDTAVSRSGLTFTLLAAPGVTTYPVYYGTSFAPRYDHGFAMTVAVGVGYLLW